jgi:hypothetical protein
MSTESWITRYDRMPIPPVESQTEYIDAGAVRIGVEYRLLTDAIAAAAAQRLEPADGRERGRVEDIDDCGVSIHVFGVRDGQAQEHLRFDCFEEDPHYHYISHARRTNEMLHMDPIADGDSVAWALERLRTRLPQMLERAGAADIAARLDARLLEAVLPRVAEAAYRARYRPDRRAVLQAALEG